MTHTIEATGWTLIHFCWQAAVIAGVYRVVCIALAKRTSQARYIAAVAALLAMPAAALFTFGWEMRSPGGMFGSASPQAMIAGDLPRIVAQGLTATSESTGT